MKNILSVFFVPLGQQSMCCFGSNLLKFRIIKTRVELESRVGGQRKPVISNLLGEVLGLIRDCFAGEECAHYSGKGAAIVAQAITQVAQSKDISLSVMLIPCLAVYSRSPAQRAQPVKPCPFKAWDPHE